MTTPRRTRKPDTVTQLHCIIDELDAMFIGRHEHIVTTFVGLLAGAHSYWLGERGTGKTALAHAICDRIEGATFFDFTFDKQMSKDDVFGPIDMGLVNERNVWVRATNNHLPTAHLALGDELDEGSVSTLNSLRAPLLNRQFFNGDYGMQPMPLMSFIAASNTALDTARLNLGALQDRFLLHLVFEPLTRPEDLLALLDAGSASPQPTRVKLADLQAAQRAVKEVKLPVEVREALVTLQLELASQRVPISNRRYKESQHLVRALAFLRGRDTATVLDLEVLQHCYWTDPADIDTVRHTVADAAGLGWLIEQITLAQNCRDRLDSHGGDQADRKRLGLAILAEIAAIRAVMHERAGDGDSALVTGLSHGALRRYLDDVAVLAMVATGYSQSNARRALA